MTIDTNILIAYLDGEEQIVALINALIEKGQTVFLPAAVEIEVLSFAQLQPSEVVEIEKFLASAFVFVPIDRTIARTASHVRRRTKIKTPDATIAATALSTFTPLLTRNVRDFKNVQGLQVQMI